jgi:hypothetical protein
MNEKHSGRNSIHAPAACASWGTRSTAVTTVLFVSGRGDGHFARLSLRRKSPAIAQLPDVQRVQQGLNTLHVQKYLPGNVREADIRTLASLLHVSKLVTWSPTAVICPTATLGALLRCTGASDAATAADMATLLWCCSSGTSLVLYTRLQLVRCLAASMPVKHQPAKLENQYC